jgi:hypothetical protein
MSFELLLSRVTDKATSHPAQSHKIEKTPTIGYATYPLVN